ncbi:hypothetical protein WDU94_008791 [Cyamophila willieti]
MLNPFFPISSKEYAHVHRIYEYQYPQNRLPQCLWIPYMDTSQPSCFRVLYVMEIYSATLGYAMATTEALFVPFVLLHLVGQHFVLSGKLKSLGTTPPSSVRVTPGLGVSGRGVKSSYQGPGVSRQGINPYSYQKREHEVAQVRQCILYHKQLIEFRTVFDSVAGQLMNTRVILLLVATSLSACPITILSQFDVNKQGLMLGECIIVLSFYGYNCLLSEILEWANCRIERDVYQNKWYTLCPEARRMMCMFLRRTQRPHYIRNLGGLVVLGNENLWKTIKLMYSFIRFVNLSGGKLGGG